MGSNPTADIFVCCLTYASFNFFVFCVVEVRAAIAQLGERQTEDLEVPGSIPGLGKIIFCGVKMGGKDLIKIPMPGLEPGSPG